MNLSCAAQLTAERCEALLSEGFLVIDGWFGEPRASDLRRELASLHAAGLLLPNRTSFAVEGRAVLFSKPHIFEADLHDARLQALFDDSLPHWKQWFSESAGSTCGQLAAALPQLALQSGGAARAVKLQVNEGGGSFPWHHDNPGPRCAHALTLLTYFNPAWTPGDGGELVLLPFLGQATAVRPLHDRAVLFLSDRVLHRVLPSRALRFAATTWFDGAAVNSAADVGLRLPPSCNAEEAARILRISPCQRAISRLVYDTEYEASLRECMSGAAGEVEMLASHAAHVAAVAERNPPLQCVLYFTPDNA